MRVPRLPVGLSRPGRRFAVPVTALAIAAAATGCGGGSTSSTTHTEKAGSSHGKTVAVVAAAYLGISRAQLHRELASGRTLAEIAASSGHTAKGLAEAILKVRLAGLQAEVKAGTLSQGQLETRMAAARRHVEQRLQRADAVSVGVVTAAAERYLHVSEARLRAERAKGRSLAQVAASIPGRSAAGLVAAVVAAEEAHLRKTGNASGPGAPSTAAIRRRAHVVVFHQPVGGKSAHGKHEAGASGEEAGGESASAQSASEGG